MSEPGTIVPAADAANNTYRGRRERQASRSARAALASKVLGVGVRFLTIPLSLRLLGIERYGLWLTVGSVLNWLAVSDLGLSSGLLNTIGDAYGRDDWCRIRRYISTAFFTYTALSLALGVLVTAISVSTAVPRLLGAGSRADLLGDARLLVLVCGIFFAASFCLNAIAPLCSALQEGYLASYAQISGVLVSVIALVVLTYRGASLAQFAVAMALPPLAASAALAGHIFLLRHPDLRPRWREWGCRSFRELLAVGGPMLVVQLGDLAILYSTNLLIAHRMGPGSVAAFAVPSAAFMVFASLAYGLVFPYLPAYSEAQGRADWSWIRHTALRLLRNAVGFMLIANAGMVALGTVAVRLWTEGRVVPDRRLLTAMAAYYTLMVWASTNGVLLMGLGRVKTKAAIHLSVAAVFIAGSWLLLPVFGLIAVPIAGIAGYSLDLATSLPCAFRHIRRLAGAQSRADMPVPRDTDSRVHARAATA